MDESLSVQADGTEAKRPRVQVGYESPDGSENLPLVSPSLPLPVGDREVHQLLTAILEELQYLRMKLEG